MSKSERTRARLAAATREEIAAAGSFTAERVAVRAEVSAGTFYAHFPTKNDALAAAFSRVLDDLVDYVDAEVTVERLLEDGLEACCRRWAGGMAGFFAQNSLVFRAAQAAMSGSAALRETYRQHESAAFERYRRFLSLGQNAGAVRRGDVEVLVRALMVLTQAFHNPLLFGSDEDDPVFDELARALHACLAPA
ncbi:MAG: TetR/AcrR family transcriptional regulator [Myxococcota bacterium]